MKGKRSRTKKEPFQSGIEEVFFRKNHPELEREEEEEEEEEKDEKDESSNLRSEQTTSFPQSGIELEMCSFPFVVVLIILTSTLVSSETFHRLLSPSPNSQLQIVPKIDVPMSMAPTVQSGMSLKLPITLKFPERSESSRRRDNESKLWSRKYLYKSIEKIHPSFGKICLLRSICEVSHIPLISPTTGLVGEIIDLVLT